MFRGRNNPTVESSNIYMSSRLQGPQLPSVGHPVFPPRILFCLLWTRQGCSVRNYEKLVSLFQNSSSSQMSNITFFPDSLWATDHYQPLRIFSGHLADVTCTRFHPNSNYVATGSSDRTIRLWDILSGNCVRIFTGHKVRRIFKAE